MLLELRDHLRREGPRTVAELEAKLAMPGPLVEDMLQRWIAKGKVQKLAASENCGRCGKPGGCAYAAAAASACAAVYGWIEDPTASGS